MQIYNYYDVNIDQIVFLDNITEDNLTYVDIIYKNKRLYIQTPLLTICHQFENLNDNLYFFVDISSDNLFNKFIIDLEKKINHTIIHNKLFNNTNLTYKTSTQLLNNNKSGLKIKLVNNDRFKTIVFNHNKEIINQQNYKNYLVKDAQVKIILQIESVWMKNNIAGTYIKPVQIQIINTQNTNNKIKYTKYEDNLSDYNNSNSENAKSISDDDNYKYIKNSSEYSESNKTTSESSESIENTSEESTSDESKYITSKSSENEDYNLTHVINISTEDSEEHLNK